MTFESQGALRWAHIGDLHLVGPTEQNYLDFVEIVDQINVTLKGKIDFVVLPGDNADDGTAEQYRMLEDVLARLEIPLFILPGDHDFKSRSMEAFYSLSTARELPFCERVAGYRCLFLDVVSAGSGGPDFRLGREQLLWLEDQLRLAQQYREPTAVFMHAYPADLMEDAEHVAKLFNEYSVLAVDMGHTHYNEISNDGTTLYMTTRSTGQIEEGPVGYSIGCVENSVVSWRFKQLRQGGPVILVTSPADIRLVTKQSFEKRTPEKQFVAARVFSQNSVLTCHVQVEQGPWILLVQSPENPEHWSGEINIPDREFTLNFRSVDEANEVAVNSIIVPSTQFRVAQQIPSGSDANAVFPWPENDLYGTQLGPNKNGKKW